MLTWFVLHVMTHGHTQNQMSGNAHLDAGGAIFFSTSTVGQKKKKCLPPLQVQLLSAMTAESFTPKHETASQYQFPFI